MLTQPARPAEGDTAGGDVDHPERDTQWDDVERHETSTQRLDRNWSSLLQDLWVVQTGVQSLTGFLLTLPFQQRFDTLDDTMRMLYLATVSCSVGIYRFARHARSYASNSLSAAPIEGFGICRTSLHGRGSAASRARPGRAPSAGTEDPPTTQC
jgi:hypothetical protein